MLCGAFLLPVENQASQSFDWRFRNITFYDRFPKGCEDETLDKCAKLTLHRDRAQGKIQKAQRVQRSVKKTEKFIATCTLS